MTKKTIIAALLVVLGLGTFAAAAEPPQAEAAKKFWVMPLVGIRSTGNFDVASEEQPYTGIMFGSAVSYGLALGYRASEILAFEVLWTRSGPDVYGTAEAGQSTPAVKDLLFGATEDQLHANLLLSTGYTMGSVKPFFLLALGMTGLNPQTNMSGFNRFSWGLGLGVDVPIKGRFGLRAQGKFVTTYINDIDEVLIDWEGGSQTTSLRNTMTQWAFETGLFYRF